MTLPRPREQQRRHGREDFHQPERDKVEDSPAVAGARAQDDANRIADQRHEQADEHRGTRAVDQARQVIAADQVGAERMRRIGEWQYADNAEIRVVVGIGRDDVGKDRQEDDEDHADQADDGQAVLTEAPDRVSNEAAMFDFRGYRIMQ